MLSPTNLNNFFSINSLSPLPTEESNGKDKEAIDFFIELLKYKRCPIHYLQIVHNMINIEILNLSSGYQNPVIKSTFTFFNRQIINLFFVYELFNKESYEEIQKVFDEVTKAWEAICAIDDKFSNSTLHSILIHLPVLLFKGDHLKIFFDNIYLEDNVQHVSDVLKPSFLLSLVDFTRDFPLFFEPLEDDCLTILLNLHEVFSFPPDPQIQQTYQNKVSELKNSISNFKSKCFVKHEKIVTAVNQILFFEWKEDSEKILFHYYHIATSNLKIILDQSFNDYEGILKVIEDFIAFFKANFKGSSLLKSVQKDKTDIFLKTCHNLFVQLDVFSKTAKFCLRSRFTSLLKLFSIIANANNLIEEKLQTSKSCADFIHTRYPFLKYKEIKKIHAIFIILITNLDSIKIKLRANKNTSIFQSIEGNYFLLFSKLLKLNFKDDYFHLINLFNSILERLFTFETLEICVASSATQELRDLIDLTLKIKELLTDDFVIVLQSPCGHKSFKIEETEPFLLDYTQVFHIHATRIFDFIESSANSIQKIKEIREHLDGLFSFVPPLLFFMNKWKDFIDQFEKRDLNLRIKAQRQLLLASEKFIKEFQELDIDFISTQSELILPPPLALEMGVTCRNLSIFTLLISQILDCFDATTEKLSYLLIQSEENKRKNKIEYTHIAKTTALKSLAITSLLSKLPEQNEQNQLANFLRKKQMDSCLKNSEFHLTLLREIYSLTPSLNTVRSTLFASFFSSTLFLEQIEKFALSYHEILKRGEHVLFILNEDSSSLRSSHHIHKLWLALETKAPPLSEEDLLLLAKIDPFISRGAGRLFFKASTPDLLTKTLFEIDDSLEQHKDALVDNLFKQSSQTILQILTFAKRLIHHHCPPAAIQENGLDAFPKLIMERVPTPDTNSSLLLSLLGKTSSLAGIKPLSCEREAKVSLEERSVFHIQLHSNLNRILNLFIETASLPEETKMKAPLFYAVNLRTLSYSLFEISLLIIETLLPPSPNGKHSLFEKGHYLNYSTDAKTHHNYDYFIQLVEEKIGNVLSMECKERILTLQSILKNDLRYPMDSSSIVGEWWAKLSERSRWCQAIESNEMTEKTASSIKKHTLMQPTDALFTLREEIGELLQLCYNEAFSVLNHVEEVLGLIRQRHQQVHVSDFV